jgi:cytochrome c6
MKNNSSQGFAIMVAIAVVIAPPLSARAQTTPETLYSPKCAACHGPDGSGTAMGKKLGVRDFHSAEVQKQTDEELTEVITKGKGKMPAFGAKIKPDDITKLVAYIRGLANKK